MSKKRDPVSDALISLRTAMGKTQQTFAVEVLKTAVVTIGRYETNRPPRGEALLRLAAIARRERLFDIAETFIIGYLTHSATKIGGKYFVESSNFKPTRLIIELPEIPISTKGRTR